MTELRDLLRSLGSYPTELEVAELMSMVDEDGDGAMSFDEFARLLVFQNEEAELQEEAQALRNAFAIFDHDGSGNLDAVEIRQALQKLGISLKQDEAEFLVGEIDKDGDGEVSFEEFFEYVMEFQVDDDDDDED